MDGLCSGNSLEIPWSHHPQWLGWSNRRMEAELLHSQFGGFGFDPTGEVKKCCPETRVGSAFPWSAAGQGRCCSLEFLLPQISAPSNFCSMEFLLPGISAPWPQAAQAEPQLWTGWGMTAGGTAVDLRRDFRAGNGFIQCLFSLLTWNRTLPAAPLQTALSAHKCTGFIGKNPISMTANNG